MSRTLSNYFLTNDKYDHWWTILHCFIKTEILIAGKQTIFTIDADLGKKGSLNIKIRGIQIFYQASVIFLHFWYNYSN